MGSQLKRRWKKGLRSLQEALGYTVVKVRPDRNRSTMEGAIQAISKRPHSFKTVVDVGASNGCWTVSCRQYFPHCQYLLFEAQPVHEPALRQLQQNHQNVQYVLKAAGESAGDLFFNAEDPFGGQASYQPYAAHNLRVPVTTVDEEIKARQCPGPYLVKLDTHGFEVPILKGAARTIEQTEVIVMECYNYRIAPECLLFPEMCQYLAKSGFRCVDLVDPLYRPYDNSFWQMDLVFIKDDRAEFAYSAYK